MANGPLILWIIVAAFAHVAVHVEDQIPTVVVYCWTIRTLEGYSGLVDYLLMSVELLCIIVCCIAESTSKYCAGHMRGLDVVNDHLDALI